MFFDGYFFSSQFFLSLFSFCSEPTFEFAFHSQPETTLTFFCYFASITLQTFTRVTSKPDGDYISWFLLTSSNLSKPAWGTHRKDGLFDIKSYELGVLIFPDLFEVRTDYLEGPITCKALWKNLGCFGPILLPFARVCVVKDVEGTNAPLIADLLLLVL